MIELFFDGGCVLRKKAYYGYIIKCDGKQWCGNGDVARETGLSRSKMTNNVAEYWALIKGVEMIKKLFTAQILPSDDVVAIKGDSNLVIKMVTKQWGYSGSRWLPHKKHPVLRDLLVKALDDLDGITWTMQWIPREDNDQADQQGRNFPGL